MLFVLNGELVIVVSAAFVTLTSGATTLAASCIADQRLLEQLTLWPNPTIVADAKAPAIPPITAVTQENVWAPCICVRDTASAVPTTYKFKWFLGQP